MHATVVPLQAMVLAARRRPREERAQMARRAAGERRLAVDLAPLGDERQGHYLATYKGSASAPNRLGGGWDWAYASTVTYTGVRKESISTRGCSSFGST